MQPSLDAPEYVDAVNAPPAVFPVTSRPPTATTSAGVESIVADSASSILNIRERYTSGGRRAGGFLVV